MRKFSFSLHPIFRFPWEILIIICSISLIYGIITHSIDTIFPAFVGGLIFLLFFSIRRFSFIALTENSLKIKLGCIANCEIDFLNIQNLSIIRHKAIYGLGVRTCGRGEVAIVTRSGDVVRLQLREKAFLRLFGIFKISFSSLRLSPEKQSEFIETLRTILTTEHVEK